MANEGSSKTSSLLASLTGEADGFPLAVDDSTPATDGADEDLFGEVPIDSPPASRKVTTSSSLLASSGLLSEVGPPGATNGGGGGLFDDVDALQKRQEEEQELLRQQEEQRQQELQRKQQEEQEKQRLLLQQQQQQEQQRLQIQQQQQQQLQQQQASYAQQQQAAYAQPQQQQPMYAPQQQPIYGQPQQQPGVMYQQQQMGHQMPPQVQQQQPPNNVSSNPLLSPTQGGFYRNHQEVPLQQQQQQQQASAGMYDNGAMFGSTTVAPTAEGRYNHTAGTPQKPSIMAGLHNTTGGTGLGLQSPIITAPPTHVPMFGRIKVSDPMLQSSEGGGLVSMMVPSTPHWTYQVQTELKQDLGGLWIVRRRFRHVVALEERLRLDVPGAILPPRPDKHATRALEEASSKQSAEFATQRAAELEVYLNALAQHPIAGNSPVLRLFLALQDDVGTAWPEVSSNAITRLTNVTAGAALKISDATADAATHLPWASSTSGGVSGVGDVSEDSAELLALASSEHVRMGAVTQAVPKLEGAVTLIREEGESAGGVGIEMNKLSKDVEGFDRDLAVPLEILANGALRHGRRTKRLGLELSVALEAYVMQYKLCKNEKAAFADRRNALAKKYKERSKADATAQRLVVVQRGVGGMTANGTGTGNLERMEAEASVLDKVAVDAIQECDEIGERLKSEVNRVSYERRLAFKESIKIISSSFKEASAERTAIWESARDAFYQAFPDDYQTQQRNTASSATGGVTSSVATGGAS